MPDGCLTIRTGSNPLDKGGTGVHNALPVVSKTKEMVRKITTNDNAFDIIKWAH